MTYQVETEEDMMALAAELAPKFQVGQVVMLFGPLGAGKTVFARGVLRALGHEGPVRSPTFTIFQFYDTEKPVLHADLYRLQDASGLGILEHIDRYVCLIEWADRLGFFIDPDQAWRVLIEIRRKGRRVQVDPPKGIKS